MSTPQPARRVMRLQLGVLLRRYREACERVPKDVVKALDWYPSKVSKLESGGVTISSAELDRLIDLYGVTGTDADRVRELGREARRRGITQPVQEWAQTYVELERSADEVKSHRGELVPGLLQTVAYARALLATGPWTFSPEELDIRAADRARRIEPFTGEGGTSLWVVLGEAALHRPVGGAAAHREQLAHLRQVAELPRVTLQILPFDVGEHTALGMDFTILELVDPSFGIVYEEALTDAVYRDATDDIERYRVAFTKLQVAAASERESARMLEARLRHLA
ncbi:MAG: helix-turn-helix domain-containing protein [Pseudonocardia sp.]